MQTLVQIERITKNAFQDRIHELDGRKRSGILESQLPLGLLSMYLAERLATQRSAPIPKCTSCGVCCAHPLVVPVEQQDTARLTNYWDILLDGATPEVVIDRVVPRDENGRCVNLQGELGGEIACTIYEDRPHCCREFEAGSDRCHEYRRMYGLEPQLTKAEIAAALAKLNTRPQRITIDDVSIVEVGKIMRTSISFVEDFEERTETLRLKIFVLLTDGTEHEIHEYNSGEEIWLEHEFLGSSIEEAKELIASRMVL